MPRRSRIAILACASALVAPALAACGDDTEDLVEEASLRECLADSELKIQPPPATAGGGLGNVSPDFTAVTAEGVEVEVVVHGSEQKAMRSAADIRGALVSFGAPASEVLQRRNTIAVVGEGASEAERAAIEDCLGG